MKKKKERKKKRLNFLPQRTNIAISIFMERTESGLLLNMFLEGS